MYMSQAMGTSQQAMGKHLKNSLEYILKPEKTRMGTLIGGNHILPDPEYAFKQMLKTKKSMEEKYGNQKTKGRQGYHFVLSFAPRDCVTPELALEITEKFVKRYIPDYECVFAVHDNTENIHSHIVFNSVDMVRGRKFHTKKTEWEKHLQPIVNQLCEEYGLSTIKIPNINERTKEPTSQKKVSDNTKMGSSGTSTKKREGYDLVVDEIWESLYLAKSRFDFDREMEKRGYQVNRKTKNGKDRVRTSVLPPGRKKNIRLNAEQESFLKELPEYCKVSKKKKMKEQNKFDVTKVSVKNSNSFVDRQDRIDRNEEKSDTTKSENYYKRENNKNSYESYKHAAKEDKTIFVRAGRKNIVHSSKVQQKYITIQSISRRYILYDYRKRKYGKYYREYIKFNQTQQKIKYLYRNNIKTVEQLGKRKEELICIQNKLEMQKQEIFQERKEYLKLFRLYEELGKLQVPVMLYRDGDSSFVEQYIRMKQIIKQMKQSGLSVDEVKEKYKDYKQQFSLIGKMERMVQKEVALCEEIWQENRPVEKREEELKINYDKERKIEKGKKKVR